MLSRSKMLHWFKSFPEQDWSKKSSGETKVESHCDQMLIKAVKLPF